MKELPIGMILKVGMSIEQVMKNLLTKKYN